MNTNDFLQKFRVVRFGSNIARPRIKCADGFTVSVQAGKGLRSCPNDDADEYRAVELGYPSQEDDLILDYTEDVFDPCATVYNFVPIETVDELLSKHGGIVGADFSNDIAHYWGEEYRNAF